MKKTNTAYSMRINKLTLEGFRNYRGQTLEFDPACNVIHGENAQGKTNLLEAMVYLSCGKSPRTRTERELISFDGGEARIIGEIYSREREFITDITLRAGSRRKMTVNGVAAKNASELSEVLHTVFFSPEDLFLIREGAAARRRFMDQSLCQLRPRYARALAEYHRLYEHKTRILRDREENPGLLAMLPDFNEGMCRMGAILIHYRAQYCRALDAYAAPAHGDCSGGREKLQLHYETVKTVVDPFAKTEDIAQNLRDHQQSHYHAELASGLCLSGPHKDDFLVEVNGRSARQFCSQGQVRTAALCLKLADREIHRSAVGEYPVMLLDDVLSELDPKRQEYVLNRISGGQVFITCCENDRLDRLQAGRLFHIRSGEVVL
ncbi:DNA replication/repair protein RecF [Vescimonas sp.]|uniref:DNA replication/repair protein RecF n=1 Tax=Vescimonas sp. TaxID=2892404 RepID=UPI00307A85C7